MGYTYIQTCVYNDYHAFFYACKWPCMCSCKRLFIRLIPFAYVLQWWNSHLLQLAATVNSILEVQPSSAAAQRIFSVVNLGFT